ncbi:period circadian protein isoform X2 [Trichogramma pretiosum]|uniref:period circadian protein isoform X2 n=1 Tax=Trichogramma pretiosum TaxID=7493 RepID=UPI000C71A5E9|nr:period circadian protein isoform X2 [Trichogramma pretiosum]
MEQGNVEESTSTKNAKISDSGYSCNTCSNSQSHTSEGDSLSRNSNRSASSGYHGGNQSTLGSCTQTIPKPISNKKEKSHKKKKTKNIITTTALIESTQALSSCTHTKPEPVTNAQIAQQVFEPVKPIVEKKTEEQAVVELVDATDPGVHNDSNSLLPTTATDAAGLAAKINPIDESSSQFTEEYYAVISLRDGLVLQATSSLHGTLGYPKESWTGKFFTDFLDPRDKQIFTETVASEIALWKDYTSSDKTGKKLRIFCRLRQFNAFQSTSKCDESYYVPFRMNLIVQNFQVTDKDSLPSQHPRMLLIASFQPLRSAYKGPEETIIPTIFSTRHNATCHYTYVDQDVVQYMGYLPQDMINRSLFCYYHPEDLPLIKDIYETIINQEESSSFRSKPYRFIVHNGGCIVIDTEWSCFVNPWTKKLEFVVGSHRVLKGPVDPNVFGPFNRKDNALTNISEEVLKEARVIRKEIEDMLVQGVKMRLRPPNNDVLLSKTNDFTTFVENVLQELRSPVPLKDHMAVDDRSFSEHDSIMLGEISPHHEYLDSNSSTETPPSYNQLNYNDTIERFFNSNVVVQGTKGPFASDSEEIAQSSANSSEELGKNNNTASRPDGRRNKDLKCAASSTNGSGNGSGSNEMLSSESNNQQSFSGGTNSNATTSQTTTNNSSNNNNNDNKNKGFKPPLLTESILHKHDAEMETLLVQKHRELKKGDKIRNKSNDQKAKAAAAAAAQSGQAPNNAANNKSSRLKRSASQTLDPEGNFKVSKHDETLKSSQQQNSLGQAIPTTSNAFANKANNRAGNLLSQPMPASLAGPAPPASAHVNNQCFANANICPQPTARYPSGFFQMLPIYYVPIPAAPIPRENPALGTIAPQDHHQQQQQQQQQHHMGFPGTVNPAPAPYCYVPMPCMPAPMSGLMYPPAAAAAFGGQHHLSHPIAAAAGMYKRSQAMMPEAATSTGNANASLAAAPKAHQQHHHHQAQLNPAQFLQAGQQLQQAQPQPQQVPGPTMSPFDDDSGNNNSSKKRPASRATSVKAEPGSSMAMSESSKKIFSPAGIVSSCLTDDGGGYVPTSSSSRINRDCRSNSSASQQLTNSSSCGLYQTTKSRESWTDNGTTLLKKKMWGPTRYI